MHNPAHFEAIDYLVIGHVANDVTPSGNRLGGTAAFSALTAKALGLKVGIVTSWGKEIPLGEVGTIPMANEPTTNSTSFENIYTRQGRQQFIHNLAHSIDYHQIPQAWRRAPIVHLGPIAQEVEPSLVRRFPEAFVGSTAQGWLREWDASGNVIHGEWPEADFVLQNADAAIISIEDVAGDEDRIEELASSSQILVVTEGAKGCRVFADAELRCCPGCDVEEVDATGAGDIFATVFFVYLNKKKNPWDAAELANQLAGLSTTRAGLASIPTQDEIFSAFAKV